jgi:hypothetical protein
MRSLLFMVLKISFPPLQRSGGNPVKTRTLQRREVIHFYGGMVAWELIPYSFCNGTMASKCFRVEFSPLKICRQRIFAAGSIAEINLLAMIFFRAQ